MGHLCELNAGGSGQFLPRLFELLFCGEHLAFGSLGYARCIQLVGIRQIRGAKIVEEDELSLLGRNAPESKDVGSPEHDRRLTKREFRL